MIYYELSDALNRCGATAKDVGVNSNNLVKLITLLHKKTECSGAVIGNSLKTIFIRLYSQKIAMLLSWSGIRVFYKNGRHKPVLALLRTLSRKYPFIHDDVYESLGGIYQINLAKILIKHIK